MPEKKILFITCWYPTQKLPAKGVFIQRHAEAIRLTNPNLLVVSINVELDSHILKTCWIERKEFSGLNVLELRISSRFYKLILALMPLMRNIYAKKIIRQINGFDTTHIHSNIISPAAFIGYSLSKKLKKPHIITEHWSKIDRFMKYNLYSSFAKKIYKNAKAVTVVSKYLSRNVLKHTPEAAVHIIPNVVNTKLYFCKPFIPSTNKSIVFTAIASWKHPKRPDLFLSALEIVSRKINKKIIINIIGDGEQLIQLKKAHYNFQIIWHGYKAGKEIVSILHDSNFFLHASEVETFSVVVAEALCTGTPAIVSNIAALTEFYAPGICLTANNTVEDWSEKILSAINVSYDEEMISQFIRNKVAPQNISEMFNSIY